jgi:hypothetical protein
MRSRHDPCPVTASPLSGEALVAWVTGFFETSGTRAASRLHRARSTGSRTSRPSSECLTEYGSRQEVSERLSRICKEIDRSPGPQREPCPPGCKVGCGGGRCGLGNRPPRRLRLRPHRARQLSVWHFGQEHSPVGARQRLRAAYPRPGPPASPSSPRRARRPPVAPVFGPGCADGGTVGRRRQHTLDRLGGTSPGRLT